MPSTTLEPCRLLVDGKWIDSAATETTSVHNPSDGTQISATPMCGHEEVSLAVEAAAAAQPEWADTPPVERAQVLFRFKALMETHFEELASLVTREHGKTLAESRGEIRRGIEVVEFACGAPSLLMGESTENISRGIDCDTVRQPMGVSTSICPFNFPFMVPLWSLPISLACGNAYILKPSEKVPLSSIRMVELLVEAGLPDGIIGLVHGGKPAVDTLLSHPKVATVSVVGSTPVARYIYETAAGHGKRVQAAGGAKNYMVLMPDADMDAALGAVMGSAYGCAGERCMAGAVLVCVGGSGEQFLPQLCQLASEWRVGPTDQDPRVQMGPVISPEHRDRVVKAIADAVAEGAEMLVDGRDPNVDTAPGGFYVGPTILNNVTPAMETAQTEIFGPVLSVMHVDDMDTALQYIDGSGYGNAGVIYTNSGVHARKFRHEVNAGMVGINVGVPAPMAFFPFSGWNNSFFGDLHVQGHECVSFFTRQKVTISRWVEGGKAFF